jgi:hypothetical protein
VKELKKKLKYHIFEGDNLEYIIKVVEKDFEINYKMYRSKGDQWSESAKGEFVEHWVGCGGLIIGMDIEDKGEDYDRFDRLKLMFDFINKYDKNMFMKYKIKKA